MKRKRIVLAVSIAALIGVIFLSSTLVANKKTPPVSEQKENLVYVKTDEATYDKVDLNMQYRGRVNSHETVSLSAEVNGKITEGAVTFKEGESFRKGELLIRIYKEDAQAKLKASKSNFLRTIAGILPDMQVDYPSSYTDWKAFFENINIEQELPELPQANTEKERVFLASKGVISEYYNLIQQEINYSRYDIYAPFNGYFKQVNREIGSIANNGVELAIIKRNDLMEIKVPVFPEDAHYLSEGLEVDITLSNGQIAKGHIDRVASFVDESTQSVNVYVKSTYKGLLEGSYVDVDFPGNQQVEAIEIPREALVENHFLYTVKDEILHKTAIEIIKPLDDAYLINGLEEGIIYVTESLVTLEEGDRVKLY